jgi:CBS domain containing-hemolysin-like protein
MIETTEIVYLVFCLIGSALYSGSESVLVSIGIDRARHILDEGGPRAAAMKFMIERPNELLTTILVGNNIVNILTASLVTVITTRYFASQAIGIATGITTLAILIFGEIIPKTFGMANAERLSVPVIRFLQVNYYFLYPFVKTMSFITKKLLGEGAQIKGRLVQKSDIEYMVSRAEKEQTIDSKQLDMLTNILEFPTIKVKDIMIPRSGVKFIQEAWSYKEIINYVKKDTHSRYPVCKGDLDKYVGFLHVKDLAFVRETQAKNFKVDKLLKKPFFVYEHMKIQIVFDQMNRRKVHLALVKDENGIVVGVITLEDIVEEILGEIQDEHDIELDIPETRDLIRGISIPGTMSLRDLDSEYEIKIPLNPNYSTVAGFILDMLGNNFPSKGQIIVWEGLYFELTRVEEYEIRDILIKDVGGEKHLFDKSKAHKTKNQS